jgi:hypothetical protein
MRLFVILAVLALAGCGTTQFKPTEYPLRAGLVKAMHVKGEPVVTNAQAQPSPVIVYSYAGTKLGSDLQAITAVMVKQTREELSKNATLEPGPQKTIALKVNSLVSHYKAFYWHSQLQFNATLGNGVVVAMDVPHSSGAVQQDLNGCIAEAVMKLLNDPRVRAYLAN